MIGRASGGHGRMQACTTSGSPPSFLLISEKASLAALARAGSASTSDGGSSPARNLLPSTYLKPSSEFWRFGASRCLSLCPGLDHGMELPVLAEGIPANGRRLLRKNWVEERADAQALDLAWCSIRHGTDPALHAA